MKVLVLGGTSHLSKAVAAEGVRRGHEVTWVARGKSGTQPEGATLVKADRDEPGGVDVLKGQRFDTVVDVASTSLRWVKDALRTISAPHWTFVSSINAYADKATTVEEYGALKVACENAVREIAGHSLVVRPGLITGPGDYMDRFSY